MKSRIASVFTFWHLQDYAFFEIPDRIFERRGKLMRHQKLSGISRILIFLYLLLLWHSIFDRLFGWHISTCHVVIGSTNHRFLGFPTDRRWLSAEYPFLFSHFFVHSDAFANISDVSA